MTLFDRHPVFAKVELSVPEVRDAYERYGPLVRRRCRLLLRDSAAAEDVCQDVFVRLLRYGGAFREADSKLGWLYRVADNCCFTRFQTKKLQPGEQLDETLEAAPAAHEDRDLALRVLASLPAELREIAVLYYVDELSQGQIGQALGVSRQTVSLRVGKLQQMLQHWRSGDD